MTTRYYLDASAWVKLYFQELGSEWIARFWAARFGTASSTLGVVEVLAAVARRMAAARVDSATIELTLHAIEADFSGFQRIPFDEPVIRIACSLPKKFKLRAADTIHLASVLRLRQISNSEIVLVASDDELLKAAAEEGIVVLDPRITPMLTGPS